MIIPLRTTHPLVDATSRDRRGFALLSALLAMILASSLATAIAFRTMEATHAAQALTLRVAAYSETESAMVHAVATLDAPMVRAMRTGVSTPISTLQPNTNVTIVRTDTTIAWLVVASQIRKGGDVARRQIGMSVRVPRDTAQHRLVPVQERGWVDLY